MLEDIEWVQGKLKYSNLIEVARSTGVTRSTLLRILHEPETVTVGEFLDVLKYFGRYV